MIEGINAAGGPGDRSRTYDGAGAFGLDAKQKLPADDNWTGAEIKACCRLAALLDLPLVAAAHNVVPVAVTAAESVEKLRTWASGRCLSADQVGICHLNWAHPAHLHGQRDQPVIDV